MNKMRTAKLQTCIPSHIDSPEQYFESYPDVMNLPFDAIELAIRELLRGYSNEKRVFLFGNGGSAALASHFACDLGKGTILGSNGRKRFRVLALTDNMPLMTAWANDSSYECVFAEQLRNFVVPGDIAFAISGSGNSPNVLRALECAREAEAINIGLTGFRGGLMKRLCDVCIVIPSENMQIIEDLHLSVTHAMFSVIRQRLSTVALAAAPTVSQAAD